MIWSNIIGNLPPKDQTVCTKVCKRLRVVVLGITHISYSIVEDTPINSPTATLTWKITTEQLNTIFEPPHTAISAVYIKLLNRTACHPYWQPSMTAGVIGCAFASVYQNAAAHKAIDTLTLSTDQTTMPALIQHIPPDIRASLTTMSVNSLITIHAQPPCFTGIVFPKMKLLRLRGWDYDVSNIPTAFPQLSHLDTHNSCLAHKLHHLVKLPKLVGLAVVTPEWEEIQGLTQLTQLNLCEYICQQPQSLLHNGCAILCTFTNLLSLTLVEYGLMTPDQARNMQAALDCVASSLHGLRLLNLRFTLPSMLVISGAFTALQSVKMTTHMQLAGPTANSTVKYLIMTREDGEVHPAAEAAIAAGVDQDAAAAVIPPVPTPFPKSCTHIHAPMHKLSAATACENLTHLVVDPIICTERYTGELLSIVKADIWPHLVEVMLKGDPYASMFPHANTGYLQLLDALASRSAVSTLQRVSISAFLLPERQAADEVVNILCRITSLKCVSLCHYNVTKANLVQLASQQQMEAVEVMDGRISEAECDAVSTDGSVKILWFEDEPGNFHNSTSWIFQVPVIVAL